MLGLPGEFLPLSQPCPPNAAARLAAGEGLVRRCLVCNAALMSGRIVNFRCGASWYFGDRSYYVFTLNQSHADRVHQLILLHHPPPATVTEVC